MHVSMARRWSLAEYRLAYATSLDGFVRIRYLAHITWPSGVGHNLERLSAFCQRKRTEDILKSAWVSVVYTECQAARVVPRRINDAVHSTAVSKVVHYGF